ncbi:MAG TPA: hypothetical protein VGN17_29560 [Bryobacteraceae bacterium]
MIAAILALAQRLGNYQNETLAKVLVGLAVALSVGFVLFVLQDARHKPVQVMSLRPGSRVKIWPSKNHEYQLRSELLLRFENTSGKPLIARSLGLELIRSRWFLRRRVPIQQLSQGILAGKGSDFVPVSDLSIAEMVSKWDVVSLHTLPMDPSLLDRSYSVRLVLSIVGESEQIVTVPVDWSLAIRTVDPDTFPSENPPVSPTIEVRTDRGGLIVAARQIQDRNKALPARATVVDIRTRDGAEWVTSSEFHRPDGKFAYHAIQLERIPRLDAGLHYGEEAKWWLVCYSDGPSTIPMYWPDRQDCPKKTLQPGKTYILYLDIEVGEIKAPFQAAWSIDAEHKATICAIDHT